jgi:hypothetical protein
MPSLAHYPMKLYPDGFAAKVKLNAKVGRVDAKGQSPLLPAFPLTRSAASSLVSAQANALELSLS